MNSRPANKHDVAVVGAGPAGMMAAIVASQTGKRVALIERNAQIGRKLLSTGNGRCNLTNTDVSVDRYHGATPGFISAVIGRFDQHATMEFFQDLGLVLKQEDNGRIYPRTNQASSVVGVLRRKLEANRVDVLLEAQVKAIQPSAGWAVSLADGRLLHCQSLIVATGGRAAHHLGSTGDGLYWAQKLGHPLTDIHAALVPVETVETWPKDVQGAKVEAKVWAVCDGKRICQSTGDLLFTAYGVSGPSIMAQAGSIAPLLKTGQVTLHIDLFPEMTNEQLDQTLLRVVRGGGRAAVVDSLAGLLPGSLIPVVLRLADVDGGTQAAAVSKLQRTSVVSVLKDLPLTVSKLRPLKEAQVTAGGLDTGQVDPDSLQSRLVKGLYFAGEILDVDGDSGGFNLQCAWSSGYVAGSIAE